MMRWMGAGAVVALMSGAAWGQTFIGNYDGHAYYVTDTPLLHAEYLAAAEGLGGYGVSINDAAEQQWLVDQLDGQTFYLIGLDDTASEGDFVWDSGEALGYTNWAVPEPNDFGGEDAVIMNWRGAGLWNDVPTNEPYLGIIEVVPAPGAGLVLGGFGLLAVRRRR